MAIDELGTLAVELDMNTRGFQSGRSKAERGLDQLERKGKKASVGLTRSFGNIARSLGKIGIAAGAAATALAALVAVKLGKDAVSLARDYELLGVRLKVLTGSAAGAAEVLKRVDDLVVKTPYGLQQMGETAASMAVVFRDNTAAVGEFTAIAADLAAAFGKPVEEIGTNLQKAFNSGLGAAEVFKDAGISGVIMEITGETDVSKISILEMAGALKVMTMQGGIAYKAAALQAKTLGGALSNTVISYENMLRSIGQGLAPAIVSLGTEVLIPFFEDLKAQVEGSEENIRSLARDAIPWLVETLSALVSVVAYGVSVFQGLATVWRVIKSVAILAGFSLIAIATPMRILMQTVFRLIAMLWNLAKAMKAGLSGDVSGAFSSFARAKQHLALIVDDTIDAYNDMDAAGRMAAESLAGVWADSGGGLESFQDVLAVTKYKLDELAGAMGRWRDRQGAPTPGEEGGGDGEPPFDLQKWLDEMMAGVAGAGTAEEESLAGSLYRVGKDSMRNGLVDGIMSGSLDAKDIMADIADTLTARMVEHGVDTIMQAMEDGFAALGDTLGDVFKDMDFGKMGGEAGADWGAGLAAAASVAMTLISGALQKTKSRQTFADIQKGAGAVETTQAIRGIVAGPTSIAVAKVGNDLADAIEPLVTIGQEQVSLLQGILNAVSTGGGGAGLGGAPEMATSPTLF